MFTACNLEKNKQKRKYEIILMCKSAIKGEILDNNLDEIYKYMKSNDIDVISTEMQQKNLYYKINGEKIANFVVINIESDPDKILSLDKKIKHKSFLLRHIILSTKAHKKNIFETKLLEGKFIHPINDLTSMIDSCGKIKISSKIKPKIKRKIAKTIKTARSIALLPLQ